MTLISKGGFLPIGIASMRIVVSQMYGTVMNVTDIIITAGD